MFVIGQVWWIKSRLRHQVVNIWSETSTLCSIVLQRSEREITKRWLKRSWNSTPPPLSLSLSLYRSREVLFLVYKQVELVLKGEAAHESGHALPYGSRACERASTDEMNKEPLSFVSNRSRQGEYNASVLIKADSQRCCVAASLWIVARRKGNRRKRRRRK